MPSSSCRPRFVERLSYHYDQWNYIHPFREGNGRTQRVFWNRVAAHAGWDLDWREVTGAVNDAACRAAAERRDFAPLHAIFDRIVSPLTAEGNDARMFEFRPAPREAFGATARESTQQSQRPPDTENPRN